jgi:hypothetical protein
MKDETEDEKKRTKQKKPREFKVRTKQNNPGNPARRQTDEKVKGTSASQIAKLLNGKTSAKLTAKASQKLLEGSQIRRGLPKASKYNKSEVVKQSNKRLLAAKRESLKTKKAELLVKRERILNQKINLEKQLKVQNRIAQVRDTIDGEYTAKFSGFESALAAGPRGATSGGLRKLSPSILFDRLGQNNAQKFQAKIDIKTAQAAGALTKYVKGLKVKAAKMKGAGKTSAAVVIPSEAPQSKATIAVSKTRMAIASIVSKENGRDPNRNPNKFSELNMPFRGMG